jgi:hypothetical protein
MAEWRYKIDLAAEHAAYRRFQQAEEDNIESEGERLDPPSLGRRVAAKIRESAAYQRRREELEPIALDMEAVEEIDDYDDALERLYDWGDRSTGAGNEWPPKRLCWIETIRMGS